MESLYRNTDECQEPVEGIVQGEIPVWLSGNLYRNGPGKFSIGDSEYEHWFDGLALLHRFRINQGKVTYNSKFIRSETYKRNMNANRIITSEFATTAYPDPCKNIFQRMFTWFTPNALTDNTLVTVTPVGDYLYTATETWAILKVDPQTLDTLEQVDLTKHAAVSMATAHYHRDTDGTLHNFGLLFKGRPSTSIFRVPPPSEGNPQFQEAQLVCSIPCRWPFHQSYYHSFGMSENYYVYVEQPLCINIKTLMLAKFTRKSFLEWLQWYGEYKGIFRVIEKKTGKQVNINTPYVADAFFVFHHINTYEDQGCLVVDLCGFDTPDAIYHHYLKNLRSEKRDPISPGTARRYVLPLDVSQQDPTDKKYTTLENSTATAVKQGDNSVLCHYEKLSDQELELPQINYERYNGKKYRYIYGTGGNYLNKLVKIDTVERQTKTWSEGDLYCSEAVFVPTPGGMKEDDGVLLAVLWEIAQPENITYLLVLDASTMTELGRVRFEVHLPRDIHGVFVPDKSTQ